MCPLYATSEITKDHWNSIKFPQVRLVRASMLRQGKDRSGGSHNENDRDTNMTPIQQATQDYSLEHKKKEVQPR